MDPAASPASSAPAAETSAPVSPDTSGPAASESALTPPPASNPTTDNNAVADEDRAEAEWFAKQGPDASTAGDSKQGEPTDTPEAPETPAPQADKPETPVVETLTEADKQVLKRFQLDEGDVQAMPAAARSKFLRNLEDRARFTDTLQQEVTAFKKGGQQQQAPQQQPAESGIPDDVWKPLEEFYGADGVKPLRAAMDRHVSAAIQPYQQINNQLAIRIIHDDIEAAFEKLELPEGVDKSDPAIREKILAEADVLLRSQFDLQKFNHRHAIPRAASSLFHQQQAAADKARKAQQQKQALRGSVDPGTRVPTQAAPVTEEVLEERWLEADRKGLSGAARESFLYAGVKR